MKNIYLFLILMLGSFVLSSQVIFEEDFESGAVPDMWTMESNASDGGWKVGTAATLSSEFFAIPSNGSTYIIGTNDDECNCNKRNEMLITPTFSLADVSTAVVSFYLHFTAGSDQQGRTETGEALVSTDEGQTWELLEFLHGHGGWDLHILNLVNYVGQEKVQIAFRYNDQGGWLYGMMLDDFSVYVPPVNDAAEVELKMADFGTTTTEFEISTAILNYGSAPITSLVLEYDVDGANNQTATFDNISIPPFSYLTLTHPRTLTIDEVGTFEVTLTVLEVNGGTDENDANNSLSKMIKIFPEVTPPNLIPDLLLTTPVSNRILARVQGLNRPTDLDFYPILAKNELWVVNQRTENTGGSTVTVQNPGQNDQTQVTKSDGNAWHFMSLPTGIAFSENGNFATSTGVQDANHNGGTFTGPSLWSSDPAIYAQPSGGNGSHLDMLHGSPFCMGIAAEKDNVFWVNDTHNRELVRYDFAEDHGPGNDDHSDAIIRRYRDFATTRLSDIPAHLVIDKRTDNLYAVDNGNNRVIRMDINSGNFSRNLPRINEALAEHSEFINTDWNAPVFEQMTAPCGIEVFENYLLVGDYETGEILVFDIDADHIEIGRIQTEDGRGLTGIKIGPDGNLYYTNRLTNVVKQMSPGDPSSTENQLGTAQISAYPNPVSREMTVDIQNGEGNDFEAILMDLTGKKLKHFNLSTGKNSLDLGQFIPGYYNLSLQNGKTSINKKVLIIR